MAVVIRRKMHEAFRENKSSNDGNITFDCWESNQTSVKFKYCYTVHYSIRLIIMLVCSFREANFALLCFSEAVCSFVLCFRPHSLFPLGVCLIQKPVTLPQIFPTLQKNFVAGYFTVNSKGRECLILSKIWIEHRDILL